MATPQKSTVWYKNPWFILACFAVLAFIGTQVPPDQSPASSFVPSVAAPAPLSVSVPAPVPATVAPPITNNNIILLGSQPDEIARLLDRVPVDTAEPAPKPEPTVSRPSEPDCIDGLAAHRQRVKEWQDLMR